MKKSYKNEATKFVIAIAGVCSILLFQNCGQQQFSFEKFEGTLCQDATAPDLVPKLKFQFLPNSHFIHFMSTPMVADLDGDGVPSILATGFSHDTSAHYDDYIAGSPVHGRNGVLWVLNGQNGNVQFSVSGKNLSPLGHASPLIIDLDHDGKAEIIYPHYRGDKVIALNHNGTHRWTYNIPSGNLLACYEGFSAHDIDGDGKTEILAGPFVLGENTTKNGAVLKLNLIEKGETAYSCNTFARSLNPVKPNEMQIISKTKVFDKLGNKLFDLHNGFHSAADINSDVMGLEVVTSGGGKLYVRNGVTGEVLVNKDLTEHSNFSCNGVIGGGPNTLGDFNGDGFGDIAIATGGSLSIYDRFGERIAGSVTQDCSSKSTGISSFDFNGDGKQEILYGDEQFFRVYHMTSSRDLEVLHQIRNPSWTLREHPIVVDVDGNGSAEIVVASNKYEGHQTEGIRVYGASSEEAWMKTLPIWNQFSYYVSHVTSNLRATSKTPTADAQAKTFRRNTQNSFFEPRCTPKDSNAG